MFFSRKVRSCGRVKKATPSQAGLGPWGDPSQAGLGSLGDPSQAGLGWWFGVVAKMGLGERGKDFV